MSDEEPAAAPRRRNRRRGPVAADFGLDQAPEPELNIQKLNQQIKDLEVQRNEIGSLIESRSDDERIDQTVRLRNQIDDLRGKILGLEVDAQAQLSPNSMADEEPAAAPRRRNRRRNRRRGLVAADVGLDQASGPELSIQRLNQQIKDLEEKRNEVGSKIESRSDDENIYETVRLRNQIVELRNKIIDLEVDAQPIPADVLIAFIMSVDKAHRYFDLKQHLRQSHLKSNNTEDDLVKKLACKNPFNNDEEDIWHAVHACLMEVRHQEACKQRAQYVKDYEDRILRNLSDHATSYTAEQRKEIQSGFPDLRDQLPETTDGYIFSDPISTLVFQAREKGYVMDVNPQVELRKIMRHHPEYYYLRFIYQEPPVVCSEKMVFVSYNSHSIDMKDIINFLSRRGKIVHRESKSEWKAGIAYITFTDSNGAKRALMKDGSLINGEPIKITQSQPVAPAPSVERAASDTESALREALGKYRRLRRKCTRLRLKNKKHPDDEKDVGMGVADKAANEESSSEQE